MSALKFKANFAEMLSAEAGKILKDNLTAAKRFQSADSFTYLLTGKSGQFIGKIYRFKHWPPPKKLKAIGKILKKHRIQHEEVIHSSYNHPLFIYGWHLSKFIPGETVSAIREKDREKWDNNLYLEKMAGLFKKIHSIKFNYFGSIHGRSKRYKSFEEFVNNELGSLNFTILKKNHPGWEKVLSNAKEEVLKKVRGLDFKNSSLVHDDANNSNVVWENNTPTLIDWVDSLAAPPLRDFATLTFTKNSKVIPLIEKFYGKKIHPEELKLHQIMLLIKLVFFYYQEKDVKNAEAMAGRLSALLTRKVPFGL